MIFLHWEKVSETFGDGCYPIFLADYEWKEYVTQTPVAMSIGYPVMQKKEEDKVSAVITACKEMRFETLISKSIRTDKDGKGIGAACFANAKFCEEFDIHS